MQSTKTAQWPWLGGRSVGWNIVLYTERLQIGFLVWAQTYVVDLIFSQSVYGRQWMLLSHIDGFPSLSSPSPFFLSKIKF